jgi:hypothetical protein
MAIRKYVRRLGHINQLQRQTGQHGPMVDKYSGAPHFLRPHTEVPNEFCGYTWSRNQAVVVALRAQSLY